ncbi:hypothetical protein AMATHDRAFT_132824, partial [Amanita thiersii Skay4041]
PHAVHFPPSPSLTRIFAAYSASIYDRSPIIIAPNACALPERGCPGRTYYSEDTHSSPKPKSRRATNNARLIHPRAFSSLADVPSTMTTSALPPLIPDLSSESEESDGFASPIPD